MAVFFGEMQIQNHPAKMPAVIHVDKADIKILSGKTQLGEWKLYQVTIEEKDPSTILFRVDDEELLLNLKEHDSFLAETASYRRDERRLRRMPTHEAFRKPDEGPTLGKELKEDVSREVSSVTEELKDLWSMIYVGTPFWIGLGVFVLLAFFLTGVVVGILFVVGVISLILGAISYVESSLAVKLPDALTPVRLIAIGVVCIALGMVVSLLFN